jgi:hypothetical protein
MQTEERVVARSIRPHRLEELRTPVREELVRNSQF